MNIIEFAKSAIRNNPGLAATAISLDCLVGIIAATVAFFIFNMTDLSVTHSLVLLVSAVFAVIGAIAAGYAFLAQNTVGFDDDDDDEEWNEDGTCPLCGNDDTGTL